MKTIIGIIGRFAALLSLILSLSSCISTKSLFIEIPEPSKKELPQNIQSLAIVTQTINNKYENLDADSLQKIFYRKNFDYDTVIYDRLVVDTTIKAMGELLFESGRYDYVIPEDRFLKRFGNVPVTAELPWNEVKRICDTYSTDALLSLDFLSTRVSTDFNRESYYNPYSDGFFTAAVAEMKIYYEALLRVYDPNQEKILTTEFMRDTLVWEDSDRSVQNLFERFTSVKQALIETGISIALDFSDKISVKWHTERRNYFDNGDEAFQQANTAVKSDNWESAISVWKEVAKNAKSKSLKSKAEFNVAVGYEIIGEIDDAISWAVKSYKTMYRMLTYDYLETLKRRKSELKEISK